MKFIYQYLKKYKLISIMAPLFKMLEAIFELLVPLVMADMIDLGITAGDQSYIRYACVILVVLAAGGFAVAITAQYFAARAANFVTRDIRRDLFEKIMSFSDAAYDTVGSRALVTRMTSDVTQVQNGVNMFLRLFLRSPFIVIGAMVMAMTISLSAAGLFCAIILILSLIVFLISKSTLPIFKNIQIRLEQLMLIVGENIEGVRVIRAFGIEDVQSEKFHGGTEELYALQNKSGGIQGLLNPLTYIVVNLGVVVLLKFGAGEVDNGVLSRGEIVALLNYLSQILVELLKFASLIIIITRGIASAGRIEDIMKMKSDARTRAPGSVVIGETGKVSAQADEQEPMIVCDDVCFAYSRGENVIEHISFELQKGETLGIVGGTGSGKSTLVRLLSHSYDVTAGTIKLKGRPVYEYRDEEISDLIADVPQKVMLFAGDVAENIRLGNQNATDEQLTEALKKAQAIDFVTEKGGLTAKVERYGRNFSGGQRQRLTIARALAIDSEILVLDDAASALDLQTEARLQRALSAEKDLTKIIISQRASSVRNADNILVLEDGWCVGQGTHDELLDECEIYQEIYYAQYPEERPVGKKEVSR